VDREADLEVESMHTCGRDRLGYVQTRPLKFVKASKFKSDKAILQFSEKSQIHVINIWPYDTGYELRHNSTTTATEYFYIQYHKERVT